MPKQRHTNKTTDRVFWVAHQNTLDFTAAVSSDNYHPSYAILKTKRKFLLDRLSASSSGRVVTASETEDKQITSSDLSVSPFYFRLQPVILLQANKNMSRTAL